MLICSTAICRDSRPSTSTRATSRGPSKVLEKGAAVRALHVRAARFRAPAAGPPEERKRQWKWNTVGAAALAADAVCAAILEALDGEPLFCSSVPVSEDGDRPFATGCSMSASWCLLVDFVVDAAAAADEGSTIYDLVRTTGR